MSLCKHIDQITDVLQREKEAVRRSLENFEKRVAQPGIPPNVRESLEADIDNMRKFLVFLEEKEFIFETTLKEELGCG